jgi:hypothetical protein
MNLTQRQLHEPEPPPRNGLFYRFKRILSAAINNKLPRVILISSASILALCAAVVLYNAKGSSVYVAGAERVGDISTTTLWKNGTVQHLSENGPIANSVFVK